MNRLIPIYGFHVQVLQCFFFLYTWFFICCSYFHVVFVFIFRLAENSIPAVTEFVAQLQILELLDNVNILSHLGVSF